MKIILIRYSDTPVGTRGRLILFLSDGSMRSWHTLEKQWKGNENKISCIPEGEYPLVWEHSPAFKTDLFELKNVPNRSEIKIHPANWERQLLGCIALGTGVTPTGISGSRKAVNEFHSCMKKTGNIIEIVSVIEK